MQQGACFDPLLLGSHTEGHRPLEHKKGFVPLVAVRCRPGSIQPRGEKHFEILGLVARNQGLDVKPGDPHRGRSIGRGNDAGR